jgi:hypothetical protein
MVSLIFFSPYVSQIAGAVQAHGGDPPRGKPWRMTPWVSIHKSKYSPQYCPVCVSATSLEKFACEMGNRADF